MQALDGLRAGYGDWLPGDKRPSDFADVVEHVASLRYALGSRLTGMRVLDHVVGDIVAQAVNLILVAMLEHARKVRHARLKTIEGVAAGRFKIRDLRQRTHLNKDVKGIYKSVAAGNRDADGVHQVQVIARAGVGDHRDSTTPTSRTIKLGKRTFLDWSS